MTPPDRTSKKISMLLHEHQTPGVVAFFDRMPGRVESAFVRGLIYQWMLDNQDAPDFDERLARVVNGPGGRLLAMPLGGSQVQPRRRPGPKPGSRRPAPQPAGDVQQAQIVMPVVDTPRQAVREQEPHHDAAVGDLASKPAPFPAPAAPVAPPASVPEHVFAADPAPTASEPQDSALTDDAMAALEALDNMF